MRTAGLFFVLMTVAVSYTGAQPGGWWTVRDWTLTYQLPDSWNSDPFSTSSVCDCPGTINDNGEWEDSKYVGMVIYPVTREDRNDRQRQQVWGHVYKSDGTISTRTFGDISWDISYGSFPGMGGDPAVMRLESNDSVKGNRMHYIVYVFGAEDAYRAEEPAIRTILESFQRRKVR